MDILKIYPNASVHIHNMIILEPFVLSMEPSRTIHNNLTCIRKLKMFQFEKSPKSQWLYANNLMQNIITLYWYVFNNILDILV